MGLCCDMMKTVVIRMGATSYFFHRLLSLYPGPLLEQQGTVCHHGLSCPLYRLSHLFPHLCLFEQTRSVFFVLAFHPRQNNLSALLTYYLRVFLHFLRVADCVVSIHMICASSDSILFYRRQRFRCSLQSLQPQILGFPHLKARHLCPGGVHFCHLASSSSCQEFLTVWGQLPLAKHNFYHTAFKYWEAWHRLSKW